MSNVGRKSHDNCGRVRLAAVVGMTALVLMGAFVPTMAIAAETPTTVAAATDTVPVQDFGLRDHLAIVRDHIRSVENLYQHWIELGLASIAAAGVLVVGLVTFFGLKTRRDIDDKVESKVDARIATKVEDLVAARLPRVEADLAEKINALRAPLEALEARLDEAKRNTERLSDGAGEELRDVKAAIEQLQEALQIQENERKTATPAEVSIDGDAIVEAQSAGFPTPAPGLRTAPPPPPPVSPAPSAAEPTTGGADDTADLVARARDESIWRRMKDALLTHKFVWRSVERLALAGGTTYDDALRILRSRPTEVKISLGKSGRTIARHVDRQP